MVQLPKASFRKGRRSSLFWIFNDLQRTFVSLIFPLPKKNCRGHIKRKVGHLPFKPSRVGLHNRLTTTTRKEGVSRQWGHRGLESSWIAFDQTAQLWNLQLWQLRSDMALAEPWAWPLWTFFWRCSFNGVRKTILPGKIWGWPPKREKRVVGVWEERKEVCEIAYA